MPNKKSAKKELRKTVKRNVANKKVSEKTKTLIKKNLKAMSVGEKKVKEELNLTFKAIDKLLKKGIIKTNTAARKKSYLQRLANKIK